MKIYTDKTYYVYALCEPDTEAVRYIGVSINPKKRLYEHTTVHSYWSDYHKAAWIAGLKEAGKKPSLVILDSCVGWEAARIEERRYYDKYNDGTLFNFPDKIYNPKNQTENIPVSLEMGRCQGITKKNKQCARKAEYEGFCCSHRRYW